MPQPDPTSHGAIDVRAPVEIHGHKTIPLPMATTIGKTKNEARNHE